MRGGLYQNVMHNSALEAYRLNAMFKCDQRNAAEFLGSILHHANLFSMLWVRAARGIRLDGTVMHYKL